MRRAVVAEVVNGRASCGEGECLERFLEHLVEVFPRSCDCVTSPTTQ
jgi:hypothetical protein